MVAFAGSVGPVAVGAFCSEAVGFVAVYDVSGVPAGDVVGSCRPHFGECHVAVGAPVVGLVVGVASDLWCCPFVVGGVVVSLVVVAHRVFLGFGLTCVVLSAIVPALMSKHPEFWSCSRWGNCSLPQSQNPGCKCSMCERHRAQIEAAKSARKRKKGKR